MLNRIKSEKAKDKVTIALEDIVRIVSDWLEPIKKEYSQGGRWDYDCFRSKYTNYSSWSFEDTCHNNHRGISVRKYMDEISIYKNIKDSVSSETLLFSFKYSNGYIFPCIEEESLRIFLSDEFRPESLSTVDAEYFSEIQLYDLWCKLYELFKIQPTVSNISDLSETESNSIEKECNLVGKLNALKPTYEFDESFLPIGSHVVIHVLKEIKTVKEWKPDGFYNGIVGGYLRHYETNNPTEIQYSGAIVIHAMNDNNEVHEFTITTSSIIDGDLEIIKVS